MKSQNNAPGGEKDAKKKVVLLKDLAPEDDFHEVRGGASQVRFGQNVDAGSLRRFFGKRGG